MLVMHKAHASTRVATQKTLELARQNLAIAQKISAHTCNHSETHIIPFRCSGSRLSNSEYGCKVGKSFGCVYVENPAPCLAKDPRC